MLFVITSYNCSIFEIEKMAKFIDKLHNVERWEIRIAFKSLYSRSDFEQIKAGRPQIDAIGKWIEENKQKIKTKILWSPDDDIKYKKAQVEAKILRARSVPQIYPIL